MKQVTVKRSVKVNLGNYENTDVGIEISATVPGDEDVQVVARDMVAQADAFLRNKVDEIELGQRKEKSKAGRFGI